MEYASAHPIVTRRSRSAKIHSGADPATVLSARATATPLPRSRTHRRTMPGASLGRTF